MPMISYSLKEVKWPYLPETSKNIPDASINLVQVVLKQTLNTNPLRQIYMLSEDLNAHNFQDTEPHKYHWHME